MQRDELTTGDGRPALWTQVRADLGMLHGGWMAVAFPQLRDRHPAMDAWTPETPATRAAYWLWAAVGALAVAVGYPLALAGFALRFHTRRLFRAAASLGRLGVLLAVGGVWAAFTVGVWLINFPMEGVVAVAAGGTVAGVSAMLSLAFARWDGRIATVLFAYPLGVTALFLPPVVAAFYSPTLADEVFPGSYSLAVWLLENPLSTIGVAEFLRAQFRLAGWGYVGMWTALSTPVGWGLGVLVTLADVVRPKAGE